MVSYLVARRSPDLLVAARQQLTIDWWQQERANYELYASEVVLQEARAGDVTEITKRMNILNNLPLLDATAEVAKLTSLLLQKGTLPPKAARDAAHIAIATVHGMDYLLS